MYTKHHTEGIILKSFERGEADRVYVIFTRAFGLVYAHASSVREEKSKLRGALLDFTYGEFTLVRARDRWRLTDARVLLATWNSLGVDAKRGVVVRMLGLVGKLSAAEDPQPELFDIVSRGMVFLSRTALSGSECANLEVLLALRVLKHLGYLGEAKPLEHLLASPFINDMLLFEAGRLRTRALSEINRSMRELPL